MTDESTFLAEERCELITLRLTPFAIGWLGAMGIWLVTFAAEGRLTAAAVIVVGVQAVILVAARALCRAAPVATFALNADGTNIMNLNAANITSGTIANAQTTGTTASAGKIVY